MLNLFQSFLLLLCLVFVSGEWMPEGPYSRARMSSTSARGLHAHKSPSPGSWPSLPVPGYLRLLPVLTFHESSALGMERLQKWNSQTMHGITKKRSYLLHFLTCPGSPALFPMPLMLPTNSSLSVFFQNYWHRPLLFFFFCFFPFPEALYYTPGFCV